MSGKSVLLVAGDGPLRRMLAEQLAALAPGYALVAANTAAEAAARAEACDLVIVADEGSAAALAALIATARGNGRGAIALVDDPSQSSPLREAGAVLLAKPVRLADLALAVKAALRPGAVPPLTLGALRLDPVTRELAAAAGAGPRVRLTEKEAAILAYLIRADGRTVPREELLAQVWGYDAAVATHTLETHVYRLRRKLAEGGGGAPRLIGEASGYRLAAGPAPASTAR